MLIKITYFVNKQLFPYFLHFNPVNSLTMERHHLEPEILQY